MPLRSKVKTRIYLFATWLLGLVSVGFIVAQDANKSPGVGELAVTSPKPPSFVQAALDKSNSSATRMRIDLKRQRLYLLVADEVAIDSPISSGRKNFTTPVGKFQAGKKELSRKQTSYGNWVDAKGTVIVAGVYGDRDPTPARLRFHAVTQDHVITVKEQNFVIHGGTVGNLPTSDGSVILPSEIAKILFGKVPNDCPIEIVAE